MDLPSLNALLRVNGLTKDSSPQNISDLLLRSGYTEEEIPEALAILNGAIPPPSITVPAAYVASTVARTHTVTYFEDQASIFTGRIGVRQFWLGMLLTVALYGVVFVIIEVSAVPLFSLISGISLFSPPDLATASVRNLLLFGVGVGMLILPALFFLAISMGLQVRRCHDFGLTGANWFMALAALAVGTYLLDRLTPLSAFSFIGALLLWLLFMSLPGTKGDNFHGLQSTYPSLWGALSGSYAETDCLSLFARRYLLPLVYLELLGIFLCVSIHSVLPRAHLPNV